MTQRRFFPWYAEVSSCCINVKRRGVLTYTKSPVIISCEELPGTLVLPLARVSVTDAAQPPTLQTWCVALQSVVVLASAEPSVLHTPSTSPRHACAPPGQTSG